MTITSKAEKLKRVTVVTKQGSIGMADIDADGLMIWRAGHWVPHFSRKQVDKMLREDVAEIIEDNGVRYRKTLGGLALPPTYQMEGRK